MLNTSLQAPNRHIHDRTALDAMQAEWIAQHGEPRKFERGFSSEWEYLQRLMGGYGYKLTYHGRRYYSIHRMDFRGVQKRISREELLKRVDEVLIKNGKQPFGLRGKP